MESDYPAPGNRFRAWQPLAPIVGPEEEGLGDGALYVYEFRADYGASFEMPYIQQSDLAIALRLIRHLNRGGTVTVNTDDASSRTYTCQKWKGTQPELGPPDPVTLRRTLKLTLRNTAEADLLCIWP